MDVIPDIAWAILLLLIGCALVVLEVFHSIGRHHRDSFGRRVHRLDRHRVSAERDDGADDRVHLCRGDGVRCADR